MLVSQSWPIRTFINNFNHYDLREGKDPMHNIIAEEGGCRGATLLTTFNGLALLDNRWAVSTQAAAGLEKIFVFNLICKLATLYISRVYSFFSVGSEYDLVHPISKFYRLFSLLCV